MVSVFLADFERHIQSVKALRTGDIVSADVPKVGSHTGRVAVRVSGSFNIQTAKGVIEGISHRHCSIIQRSDGYAYFLQSTIALNRKEAARQAA
jgi:hypothetical protein